MRFSRIWLIVLALILIVSLPVPSSSLVVADVGKLRWDTVNIPPVYTPANPQGHIVVPNSEANVLAVGKDGKTLYLGDIRNSRLLRSINSGLTWDAIHQNLPPAVLPVYQLAVAPDDEKIVAAVVSGRTNLYVSIDGGFTWNNTSLVLPATEMIASVDISPGYIYGTGTVHDYGVVTRDVTPGPGKVYLFQDRPNLPDVWTSQAAPAQSFLSIRFPADYASGFFYAVAGTDATGTWLNLGTRNVNSNNTLWNAAGGYVNYPVKIVSGAVSPAWGTVVTVDLALPSDFCISTTRTTWLALDDGGGVASIGDVYRLDGDRLYRLRSPQNRPYALAYYGTSDSGKLIVGGVYGASITANLALWRTSDPRSSLPVWDFADKPPTGGRGIGAGQARLALAWSPDGGQAYSASSSTAVINTPAAWAVGANWLAGANNDESAFSWSTDDGETWNQPGYIDTVISGGPGVGALNDVAPSEDGKVVYLSSFNTLGFDSLWRSVSLPLGKYWERVRCVSAPGHQPILRLAPGEKAGAVIYWADRGGATNLIERSLDFGQTWFSTLNSVMVDDFAPMDRDTLWVLRGTQVSKGQSVETGWRWGAPVTTGDVAGHMLAVRGNVMAIGPVAGDPRVVISTDGGSNFQTIREPVPPGFGIGNCHVSINPDFANNRYIYLADDLNGGVFRWKVGASQKYEQVTPGLATHFGIFAQAANTVYASRGTAGQGADRTIESNRDLTNSRMVWDQLRDNLAATSTFNAEPSSLKVAGVFPGIVLWAVDTTNNQLVAFLDSLTEDKPLIGQPRPAPGIEAAVMPLGNNGFNAPFTMRWTASSPLLYTDLPIRFEAQIALSPSFSDVIIATFVTGAASEGVWVVPANTLMAGQRYSARARVVGTSPTNDIHSPWSDALPLAASVGVPVAQRYAGPNALTPTGGAAAVPTDNTSFSWSVVPGATRYAFWLASDPGMQKMLAAIVTTSSTYSYDKKLDFSTTYYWQVQAVQPAVGDKSTVFSFTTGSPPPVPAVPPVPQIVPAPATTVLDPQVSEGVSPFVWAGIALAGILFSVILVLVIRTRRY
jgi:hypothetical protein